MIYEFKKGKYLISSDKRKLQIKTIHNFLTNAYWSKGIMIERVRKAIEGSLCFGVYHEKEQVGFVRVVTDYANFGYIADVFIIENYRGKGLSVWLLKCILNLPELKDIKSWMLATKDAHGLYSKFGFEQLKKPQKFMQKINPKCFSIVR
ncbi:MAG: GNAT family N-acetyltransferase [Ignavibacteriae bacterium HGW-Ignavibacteriae-3]|nr:MAG: GNAT family N-acetyltransferase [Ignavibacteriae bacterium HGW-Ignavibacteriae-3]